MSRYQKGKTNLDFTEARESEWQWHQLGHMQVCTSLQTDSYASTPTLSFLQAGCPSCRPINSVKALKALTRCSAIAKKYCHASRSQPGSGFESGHKLKPNLRSGLESSWIQIWTQTRNRMYGAFSGKACKAAVILRKMSNIIYCKPRAGCFDGICDVQSYLHCTEMNVK